MVKFENESVISEYVQAEIEDPSPQRQGGDRIIYLSRNNPGHSKSAPSAPKIADFGLAATSDYFHRPIQPDCFRAAEVILEAGWTYSVGVWNLGVLVCRITYPDLKGIFLCPARSTESKYLIKQIWELLERTILFALMTNANTQPNLTSRK